VFAGYYGHRAATDAAFTDGWFRTGDLAEVDHGYLRILGRAGDLVISGGFNVYPAEVEDVLLRHPSVADVAVTGTPSDEWGEVVTAWVVPAGEGERDSEALLAFAAGELAPYKRPRLVHFVAELPRNAMGKVLRSELRSGPVPSSGGLTS
jgi:acyl-CoA synthetase (AMP-forming)/AMP-acid ligase II